MKETWKNVVGYEGLYEVSDLGKIKSLIRKGLILKPNNNGIGYLKVGLYKNKKVKYHYIHRLVAKSFLINIKKYPEVNHKNGIKTDNRVENLEWCTKLENMSHAFKCLNINKNLKMKKGEKHFHSKLSKNDVLEIRKKYVPYKYSLSMLAKEYGVHRTNISHIINRITWNHI